jgi:hypothetical protein
MPTLGERYVEINLFLTVTSLKNIVKNVFDAFCGFR